MSRVVQIIVDSKLDSSIKKLNEELKKTNEEIVSSNAIVKSDGSSVLVISVKKSAASESKVSKKNLLLDQIPDFFNGKSILLD